MDLPPNLPDPNSTNNQNMENDVNQWCADNAQMTVDKDALTDALTKMKTDITNGNTDGAMMLLFTAVLPGVLAYQQDSMSMLGDCQNISTDLRNFNNNIQDDFNAGENIDGPKNPNQGQDLVNNVKDLNIWAGYLSNTQAGGWTGGPKGNAPLSSDDASDIEKSTADIQNQFTNNGALAWNGSTVESQMKTWFATPPSNGTTDPTAPNGAIKGIQGDNQQINSAVSSQATTLNTQIQFFTSQYNQFVNVDSSLQKSQISQDNSFINNQKTQ